MRLDDTAGWNMQYRCQVIAWLEIILITRHTAISAPTRPVWPEPLSSGNDLCFPNLPGSSGELNPGTFNSSAIKYSTEVGVAHTTWKISDTLSLAVTICNWEPSPDTIIAVLAEAATVVGKKPATGLLDRKFTQRSHNKYNTLYFEISPGYTYRHLTWGDVGELLGENGLIKFFETTRQWHTVYFDVLHTTRGELWQGAVRRGWQLQPSGRKNGTAADHFVNEI